MAGTHLQILGICGSLRRKSSNLAALRAAGELMPQGMKLEIADIADLPMFNQDVLDAGVPAPVARLKAQIAAADGVLVASPEYNFSVTAPLKNAIDWVSRLPDQPFQHKPVALLSASIGPLGGACVQYDLRKILVQLWAYVLPRPEVFIGMAATKFDADGRLTDETTRKFIGDLLTGFRDWIARTARK